MANIRIVCITSLIVFSLFTASICSAYSGGSGTQADPYRIADVNNWQQLMNTSAHWNKCFILTADIDLIGVAVTPVGNSTTSFTGFFDGNNHAIRNAIINMPSSDYVGLFGNVGSYDIKNLGVEDVNITGRDYVGGLAGYSFGKSNGFKGCDGSPNVTSCYVTGLVSGEHYVGGLVGYNNGGIVSCYTTSIVDGNSFVGGLVGWNICAVTSCHATGSVSGVGDFGGYVGGLMGANDKYAINCYAAGDVTGVGNHVGGFAGANSGGTAISCYATGSVIGNDDVGGFAGDNWGTVTSCYASGPVNGGVYVGGLVGFNDSGTYSGYVTSCYATGLVSGNNHVGGLMGWNGLPRTVTLSFWDTETSDQSTSASGTGLTTIQMMQQASFTGWDFSSTDGDAADWIMLRPDEDYPRLAWQKIYEGDIAGLYGVNMFDLKELATHWLQTGCPTGCEDADIDGSGTVDFNDYALLAKHWLEGI